MLRSQYQLWLSRVYSLPWPYSRYPHAHPIQNPGSRCAEIFIMTNMELNVQSSITTWWETSRSQWVSAGDSQMKACWVSGSQLVGVQRRGLSTSTQSEGGSGWLRAPCLHCLLSPRAAESPERGEQWLTWDHILYIESGATKNLFSLNSFCFILH